MGIPALKEIVEERKEKAIGKLSTSYAKNRLPLEEYERLVEYINKIESERELVVVEKIVAEYDGNEEKARPAYAGDDDDDDDDEGKPGYYQSHWGKSTYNNMTILSSRTFQGPVTTGAQFMSLLGSGQVTVRKADLSQRRTVLQMVAILGDCTVFVEPGINVINKVIPVLGNADVHHKVRKMAEAGAPELIINGTALLGTISIKPLKD